MADDATGALEAGAILAGLGFETAVELGAWETTPAPANVRLVPTRHDSPEKARERIRETLARLEHFWGSIVPMQLYWKTDSTLRGPIGACFDVLLEAFPGRPLVYVPAYPAMGRTVADGVLLLDGVPIAQTVFAEDGRNPMRGSGVAEVIAPDCSFPIRSIRTARELRAGLEVGRGEVLICDAGTDADIAALLAECRGAHLAPLIAGPAGGIRAWAGDSGARVARRARVEEVSRWLVVCGSRHPAARARLTHARQLGFDVLATPDVRSNDAGAELAALADQAAALVRKAATLERQAAGEARIGIVIFGGDTVLAVCRAMGLARLFPVGELMPGVAVSRAGECIFVTIAGGFSAPGVLEALLAAEAR